MRRMIYGVAAAVFVTAFAAAGEPQQSWAEDFHASFIASLVGIPLVEEPGTWLERRQGLFSALERAGLNSREAGILAARLMLSWDLDLRSGLSLQDADGRLRQASAVMSLGEGNERVRQERLIRSLRSAQGRRGGAPSAARGPVLPGPADKGFGRR